ncbi:uncharacterized protein PpBr36_10294 [Pyricularia pennisetigena]|uniref:uncharacterized protein n=1 Tax=Pyricularia pennisetigena TaxID=1578925 RepID=UPI00114FFD5D|nr:uncharacterized protein PpBr36_10294 [Pyricularia pennisetigena]TLS21565.1 hypothetical protein PpBr36_10294 [Pyricularia pennisetigena]
MMDTRVVLVPPRPAKSQDSMSAQSVHGSSGETLILTPSWTFRTPMKSNLMWLKGSGMHVVTNLFA